jgi:monofunctional glycosyltransferase
MTLRLPEACCPVKSWQMAEPENTAPLHKGRNALNHGMRLAAAALLALGVAWVALMVWHLARPASSTPMQMRKFWGEPVDQRWVALGAISPHLAKAVIAAEDQRFCWHGGVDWGELRDVLAEEGGPSRGASTLTMQTVKNLYLWLGRSYLRKVLEIPMALVVDLVWPKRRIMEVYLNIAEWGDGIFGAEAAARRHFGKAARDLTISEAARLAAALPNPRLSDPRNANSASRRIAQRMASIGTLADCLD